MTEYSVEIQPDFLERQTKAQPIAAVAELIWNGLDADATAITVDLEDDQLGGMRRIIVTDNGHGIPHADAPTLFRNLGGSWKKHGARTKLRNRQLHGQVSVVRVIETTGCGN
jgi:DNA topoisomerase VI subunit B